MGLPERLAIRLALGGLALAGGSPGHARDCSVASDSPTFPGDTAAFTLVCDTAAEGMVGWDFGDGKRQDSAVGATTARHAFAAAGGYRITAGVEGEPYGFVGRHAVVNPPTPVAPSHTNTLLYDKARARVWCVNQDNNSVSVFDPAAKARLKEIPVGRNPRTLAQDSLGRIWVANQDDATLTLVDGMTFSVVRTVALPRASRPYGVCLAPGGGTAYVTLEGTGKLLRLDAASAQVTGQLDLFPSPRAIAVTHDGSRILVTRYISPEYHGEVADVKAEPFALARVIPLAYEGDPTQAGGIWGMPNALGSIAISPDGKRAWLPFVKDNIRLGSFVTPSGGVPGFETTVRTVLTQIDLGKGEEDRGSRHDFSQLSMADALAFDGLGAKAYVATPSGNAIAVFDAPSGEERARFDPEDPLQGLAPDGMVFAPGDSLLFVHYFLGRGVGIYAADGADPDEPFRKAAWMPAVGKEALPPGVLRGKRVFYNAADPRMSLHRYMSCALCHLDGASDGRVWDFTHKGEGLRRTTSLLGKAGLGRGPLHWTGNFDEVQDFEGEIRDGFAGYGFMDDGVFLTGGRDLPLGARKAGLSPDLDALAEYVSSLAEARPSPYRNPDGTLTADAAEGEKLFKSPEVGCAVCHAPPGYDDSGPAPGPGGSDPGGYRLHDVGTNGNPGAGRRLGDTLTGFDTPSLLGIWETGPYLHDGSAATLMDVITTSNPGDRHGHTSQLSAKQKDQLVAFLRQIESVPEPSRARRAPALRSETFRLRRAGQGLLVEWAGFAGKDARLSIYAPSGRRLARLEPDPGYGPGVPLSFGWTGPGAGAKGPGVYLMRLDWPGGSASRRVYVP